MNSPHNGSAKTRIAGFEIAAQCPRLVLLARLFFGAAVLGSTSFSAVYGDTLVSFTAGLGSRPIADPEGHPIADRLFVKVGAFVPDDSLPDQHLHLASVPSSRWVEFGTELVQPIFSQTFGLFAQISGASDSLAALPVCILVLRTEDGAPPRMDATNIEALGAFATASGSLTFPPQNALPPTDALLFNTDELDKSIFGTVEPGYLKLTKVTPAIALAYSSIFGHAHPLSDASNDGISSSTRQIQSPQLFLQADSKQPRTLSVRAINFPKGSRVQVQLEISGDLFTWESLPPFQVDSDRLGVGIPVQLPIATSAQNGFVRAILRTIW